MIRIVFIVLILSQILFSRMYLKNDPMPTNHIMSILPTECDDRCLKRLLKKGEIFSFLSLYNNQTRDKYLLRTYERYKSLFQTNKVGKIYINVIMSSSAIGNYVNTITDSMLAYLSLRFVDFELNFIDIKSESQENIQKAIDEIENSGHMNTIAIITDIAVHNLLESNHQKLNIFVPTINVGDMRIENPYKNIYFAGISYRNQINIIKDLMQDANISVFEEDNPVSKKITSIFMEDMEVQYFKTIKQNQTRFKKTIKTKKLNNSFVFFGTSLIKTSILLSNITYYDRDIIRAYSTQLNYNPVMLHLAQEKDREKFYILNSIMNLDELIIEYNNILKANIEYDWALYTSTVSLDYMLSKYFNIPQIMNVALENNNFIYDIETVSPLFNKFIRVENNESVLSEELNYELLQQ